MPSGTAVPTARKRTHRSWLEETWGSREGTVRVEEMEKAGSRGNCPNRLQVSALLSPLAFQLSPKHTPAAHLTSPAPTLQMPPQSFLPSSAKMMVEGSRNPPRNVGERNIPPQTTLK